LLDLVAKDSEVKIATLRSMAPSTRPIVVSAGGSVTVTVPGTAPAAVRPAFFAATVRGRSPGVRVAARIRRILQGFDHFGRLVPGQSAVLGHSQDSIDFFAHRLTPFLTPPTLR
jgi:hypothetical protein